MSCHNCNYSLIGHCGNTCIKSILEDLTNRVNELTPKSFLMNVNISNTSPEVATDKASYMYKFPCNIDTNIFNEIMNSFHCIMEVSGTVDEQNVKFVFTKVYSNCPGNSIDFMGGFDRTSTNGSNNRAVLLYNSKETSYYFRWITSNNKDSEMITKIITKNDNSMLTLKLTYYKMPSEKYIEHLY